VERYVRGALAVALEYARDRYDAEDIVQDAFVRTLRELHRFDDRLSFRPWFYTIVRNLGGTPRCGGRARPTSPSLTTRSRPVLTAMPRRTRSCDASSTGSWRA
jgi:hypothetical protein